jgi:hypothetical protein
MSRTRRAYRRRVLSTRPLVAAGHNYAAGDTPQYDPDRQCPSEHDFNASEFQPRPSCCLRNWTSARGCARTAANHNQEPPRRRPDAHQRQRSPEAAASTTPAPRSRSARTPAQPACRCHHLRTGGRDLRFRRRPPNRIYHLAPLAPLTFSVIYATRHRVGRIRIVGLLLMRGWMTVQQDGSPANTAASASSAAKSLCRLFAFVRRTRRELITRDLPPRQLSASVTTGNRTGIFQKVRRRQPRPRSPQSQNLLRPCCHSRYPRRSDGTLELTGRASPNSSSISRPLKPATSDNRHACF